MSRPKQPTKSIKSASAFSDHKRKALIRKEWCKPQLSELTKLLKNKLVYIGLPDIQALDIMEWLEHIDKVIAFQCSNYNGEKIDVTELDKKLKELERKQHIRSGFVYQGWMEDIVMGAASERGDTYKQSDYLRIYNLDFCNNLKTPREVKDVNGKIIKVIHKIDVIKRLLEHQNTVSAANNSTFIMYLTVNANSFNDNNKILDKEINEYLKKINKITKPEVKAARLMKAYCFNVLKTIFEEQKFHVEFLPPVYYLGSSYPNRSSAGKSIDNHRMMTFTILGRQRVDEKEQLHKQSPSTFLGQKFIWATDTTISPYKDTYIEESDCEHDSIKLIAAAEILKVFKPLAKPL